MPNSPSFPLLDQIADPAALRQLSPEQLPDLAAELRAFLFHTLQQCGGHFGANLGTVELAIALHYVFNTPEDKLVWDVGHQAYPHKILTGRRDALHTIRQTQGLAPFPVRSESPYDAFGVGHSSTSISAALGMALAFERQHRLQTLSTCPHTIAVIGDGAMTAGMAFEALNHAGAARTNLLVIVNDNDMSISENVGALSNYFARILSSQLYTSLREGSKKFLNVMPPLKDFARKVELHMKGMVVPGTLFEELGFNYLGPVDGHDLPLLLKTLQTLKPVEGPRLLHVITCKGKGYHPAETDPIGYHAVSPQFDTPYCSGKPAGSLTYSEIFGNWLCDMAAQQPELIAITPAMREGSGMVRFAQTFPEQYIDVGIAEQHSITLAAGLACEGIKPVVAIYSTFLQRAYDQLIHDVALQNLPVLFALDRAGIVGGDGATHQGAFDLSYLRCIPNLIIMTPSDENECRQLLTTGFFHQGPAAVRYPRGCGPGATIDPALTVLPIGKAVVKRPGARVALLAFGAPFTAAMAAGNILNATVVDMRFVKPLDTTLIQQLAAQHDLLVTLEENVIQGGAGSAVAEYMGQAGLACPLLLLGLPDQFIPHGDPKQLLMQYGLDAHSIVSAVQARLSSLPKDSNKSSNKPVPRKHTEKMG